MYILENKTTKKLTEDSKARDFMTKNEAKLKLKLVNFLKTGKLYEIDPKTRQKREVYSTLPHAKYAACLDKFIVQIVPLGKQPATAAISFDEGIIYINQGFLRDPNTFGQLNVIMRHELCHNLLMHQIRMIKYLKDAVPELHLRTSMSIHTLLNIIEDFEISNKKYTDEDKYTVRHTWLNGKIISGLVTEDHRKGWQNMTLEQMYDAITKEMEAYGWTGEINSYEPSGNLSQAAAKLTSYKKLAKQTADYDSLEDFHKAIANKENKLPDNYEDIFKGLQKIIDDPDNEYTAKDLDKMIQDIANSKPIAQCDVQSPVTGEIFVTVYTPEEKQVAIVCLKIIKGETGYQADYIAWYQEIMKKLKDSDYTDDEIRDLLNACR